MITKRTPPWVAAFSFMSVVMAHAQTVPSPNVAACLSCHGTSNQPSSFPDLAALDAPTLIAAMSAFRTGERPATIMNRIAKGYSDAETQELAEDLTAYLRGAKR